MRSQTFARTTVEIKNETGMAISPAHQLQKASAVPPETERVLILDGNTRAALAATRSLGKRGIHTVVADEKKWTLSGASRYCRESFTYPSPSENTEIFVATVKAEAARRNIDVILPMTELSTSTVLRHRKELSAFCVPFAELATFDALTDKWRLLKLAQQLHLSVPKTHFVEGARSLNKICGELSFPVVLKPHRSMLLADGRWIRTSVHYARSPEELRDTLARYEYFRYSFLIQEYISGRAEGVFALYDRGRSVAFFAHRRLRERPPWGGVSVLSESIHPNPEAQRIARALLDSVGWHGVAMVEFKVSAEGTPYLMEVNGRFWGSLQLAIDAGVDFPWLLYQLACGRDLENIKPYNTGVRCRWLLGDFVSLAKVLLSNGSNPNPLLYRKRQALLEFLSFSGEPARHEINRWDDLNPFLLEVSQYLANKASDVVRSMAKGPK